MYENICCCILFIILVLRRRRRKRRCICVQSVVLIAAKWLHKYVCLDQVYYCFRLCFISPFERSASTPSAIPFHIMTSYSLADKCCLCFNFIYLESCLVSCVYIWLSFILRYLSGLCNNYPMRNEKQDQRKKNHNKQEQICLAYFLGWVSFCPRSRIQRSSQSVRVVAFLLASFQINISNIFVCFTKIWSNALRLYYRIMKMLYKW